MQLSLKQIQREVGITFCFVTHDQEEALTMSDRIAVFNDGRIEQVATPTELYESPASPFVAGFVGTSNLLTGAEARAVIGRDGTFSIRPEKIHLGSDSADVPVRASGVVQDVVYLGSVNHYLVGLEGGTTLTVLRQNLRGDTHASMTRRGERVDLAWDDAHLIDLTGGALAAGTATHEGEPT
jgi:putative spermidine/putrescine transport system ATP-binding protein